MEFATVAAAGSLILQSLVNSGMLREKPFRCLLCIAVVGWRGCRCRAVAGRGLCRLAGIAAAAGTGRRVSSAPAASAAAAQAEPSACGGCSAAPAAMVKIDRNGLITLVNAQAGPVWPFARRDARPAGGDAGSRALPQRSPAVSRRLSAAPQTRVMGAGRELFGLRWDGSEFPLEIGLN